MQSPLSAVRWSPYVAGAAIGLLSWFSFASADHALGITTAFEHTAALALGAVVPGIAEGPYFAANDRPKIGWEWMLVVGVFAGAWASSRLSGDRTRTAVPELWRARFGPNEGVRLLSAFFGGVILMLGARIAGGCTSGHAISGALQLAVSSWVFTAVMFSTAILAAHGLYARTRGVRVR